ncbi:type VI secretion system, membrane platform protein [Campylobacter novaezeelandiae]|nr:type VI secretion system lipoprotein TssJ [Campylobacter novaezeelandiae]QWU80757.1 type VI secretion system, membrane platform protein [Campylobacter novaezeelandiae]QWU80760.1 type VI secretion system, membrane platform protein [Campylobacter novaezeelandiae]
MHKKIFLTLCFLLFNACSSTVGIKIINEENSNLNKRLDDVPLTIIIYQLKDISKFKESNNADLISQDQILSKDKIDALRLQLAPKEQTLALEVKDDETPFIGVLVLYTNGTISKIYTSTKDAKGFGKNKLLIFEINKEGIKKL